ncbi:feruloyl esterase [Lipomyces tetrasporus]|uniref:Carboxylic ester hydrolase n=1 Tax=Lipomyces tetrasporus TaxID=54092 RepID=A0AAD7QSE7_9ASCO|nr:feruloyl esterase [Lipomyces tetrasporus]KAJ8100426.1 feruloyl esterase [Lipomyces tetrasporus]
MKILSLFYLAASLLGVVAANDANQGHTKNSCIHLNAPHVPGANVISIKAMELLNHTVPATPPFLLDSIYGLNVCEVDVVLTHPGADDQVLVKVWLPLEDWNGRFQANGGSGYAAGEFDLTLGPSVKLGYSSASTDAGVAVNPLTPETWALLPNGSVNMVTLTNFAYRSIHDMAIVGKEITEQFYGSKARYSYWNGCSTGGRQAMVAAQRYPDLFDGILAGAPAIFWASYVVAEQWPQVVMREENTFPSQCELKAFTDAAIAQCDELDGIKDGIISDPDLCHFDPYRLVGTCVCCNGIEVTISEAVARVVLKTLQGPFGPSGQSLWYGLNVGTALDFLVNTTVVSGQRVGLPFFVNDAWIRYYLAKDANYNIGDIDYSTFDRLLSQSEREYGSIIGTDNPDLSGFQKAGGKLLMWHGLSDQLIFPKGTIDYRDRVERLMGGSAKVNEFFRLFLAPGVDHCAGTPTLGAVPSDPLGALVTWVEEKKAPATLAASVSGSQRGARILCPYPLVAHYVGGNPRSAQSFQCI